MRLSGAGFSEDEQSTALAVSKDVPQTQLDALERSAVVVGNVGDPRVPRVVYSVRKRRRAGLEEGAVLARGVGLHEKSFP